MRQAPGSDYASDAEPHTRIGARAGRGPAAPAAQVEAGEREQRSTEVHLLMRARRSVCHRCLSVCAPRLSRTRELVREACACDTTRVEQRGLARIRENHVVALHDGRREGDRVARRVVDCERGGREQRLL